MLYCTDAELSPSYLQFFSSVSVLPLSSCLLARERLVEWDSSTFPIWVCLLSTFLLCWPASEPFMQVFSIDPQSLLETNLKTVLQNPGKGWGERYSKLKRHAQRHEDGKGHSNWEPGHGSIWRWIGKAWVSHHGGHHWGIPSDIFTFLHFPCWDYFKC